MDLVAMPRDELSMQIQERELQQPSERKVAEGDVAAAYMLALVRLKPSGGGTHWKTGI